MKAAIFDLDGTVIVNEDIYGRAFRMVLEQQSVNVDLSKPQTPGIGVEANWRNLIAKYKLPDSSSIEELSRETQKAYLSMIDEVQLREGFDRLIYDLRDHGVQTALATSNTKIVTDRIADYLMLQRFFEAFVTVDEVERPKPSPDIFMKAAEKLDVSPTNCVVIEDAPAGIEAAKAAGMRAVLLNDNVSGIGEDLHVLSFNDLSYDKLF